MIAPRSRIAPPHPRIFTMKRTNRYIAPWLREDLASDKATQEALAEMRDLPAIYHCVSRIVDRRRLFGPLEKEHFVDLIHTYARFANLRILAYCVMSDHFHVLVEVPETPRDLENWTDEQLFEHIAPLYTEPRMKAFRELLAELRDEGDAEGVELFREKFFQRIGSLSAFMHDLKMRFAHWFNGTHNRKGTLWSEKFKSVVVESGHTARMLAAYIDLNPVRAGLVEDPKDYRWCGYAEAMTGSQPAREALTRTVFSEKTQKSGKAAGSWEDALAIYQTYLSPDDSIGAAARNLGAKKCEAEMLRHRVRYFLNGRALGSEEFVEKAFVLTRDHFGARRRSGARKFHQIDSDLRSLRLRGLRKNLRD